MAVLALSFFLWISLSLFQRLLGPWGTDWDIQQRTSLFLMAANDLTPLRAGTDDPLPLLLAFLNLMLTLYLSIAILWLLVRVEREKMVKLQRETAKKAADKMKAGVRVARRSVVAFGNVASQAVGNTNKAGMMALSNVRGSVAVARGSVANAAGRKKRGGPGSVPLPLQIEASGSDEGSASKSRGRLAQSAYGVEGEAPRRLLVPV